MTSNPHHRKIELQSPADLSHIEAQIRSVSRRKLDDAFPPLQNAHAPVDEFRQKPEELVQKFVEEVLRGVRRNVSVNGMDVHGDAGADGDGEVREEFEGFDGRLKERLERMVERKDRLVEEVSAMRRGAPGRGAERFRVAFVEESRRLMEEEERVAEEAMGGIEEGELVLGGVQRLEEVRRNYEGGVGGLGGLKGGLPETRARLERGVGVVGHLEGK